MTKRMLIDAAHPEETRVVIVDGTRVEELDFESRHKRQLRGNVYLAKVTRVEPSLQAAFIDYGGNRHGFLAFSEIHPDYYQIPYEDKLALQQEDEQVLSDDSDDDVEEDENLDPDADDAADENDEEVAEEQVKVASKRRKQARKRRYKIQEVIKRGQILLVQAVKEERGNKGAAMTTYLSLAGRYCVLMPNTPRGGGISRKIANGSDRKRLKTIMDDLEVPQGMGVIVRTAGAKRTKAEITRDYSYLSRLWDEIRDTTLKSVAPALIHEEGNLVKRSIRDLYNKDIEEVLVQGEEAYKTAKGFIKMLMPSHSKFVKRYDDMIPLFLRYDVERQIESSLDATVQLKSGGYLVIHPTEALVSVDVNSGKSTKERNVERTALKTNMEAAEELARQMRLRDLAGLIVVDFIDMDESKNNRAVEKKMKDSLSTDRARIQTGRISQFGLMEMSRQRRRRSLLEGSTTVCGHCDGVGRKRTVESAALAAVRALEDFAIRGKAKKIRLKCPPDVALYLLNEKRDLLTKVDELADTFTVVEHDDDLIRPNFVIEVTEKRSDKRKDPLVEIEKEIREETKRTEQERQRARSNPKETESKEDNEAEEETSEVREEDEDGKPRRRRGRRGGRNRKRRSSESEAKDQDEDTSPDDNATDVSGDETGKSDTRKDDNASTGKPRRRRRRRAPTRSEGQSDEGETDVSEAVDDKDTVEKDTPPKSRRRRGGTRRKAPSRNTSSDSDDGDDAVVETADRDEADPKPARRRRAPTRNTSDDSESKPTRRRKAPAKAKVEAEDDVEEAPAKPARRRAAPKRDTEDASEAKPKRKRAPSKPKVDASEEDEAPKKPARRRKAPAKTPKEASKPVEGRDEDQAPKPARRRKAPSKASGKTVEKTPAEAQEDEAPKPARRRKAPTKATEVETEAEAPKPARRRKAAPKASTKPVEAEADEAPAKPARKRAAPKKTVKAEADTTDAPKPKRRAPAKKAAPAKAKTPAAPVKPAPAEPAPVEPTAEKAPKPVRRRKAPARKAAPAAPAQETAPSQPPKDEAPAPVQDEKVGRRKAPPRRKRGLIDRLMGKE